MFSSFLLTTSELLPEGQLCTWFDEDYKQEVYSWQDCPFLVPSAARVACEISLPSSLPARVAFREKDVCDLPPKIRKSVPNLVMSADWFDR